MIKYTFVSNYVLKISFLFSLFCVLLSYSMLLFNVTLSFGIIRFLPFPFPCPHPPFFIYLFFSSHQFFNFPQGTKLNGDLYTNEIHLAYVPIPHELFFYHDMLNQLTIFIYSVVIKSSEL